MHKPVILLLRWLKSVCGCRNHSYKQCCILTVSNYSRWGHISLPCCVQGRSWVWLRMGQCKISWRQPCSPNISVENRHCFNLRLTLNNHIKSTSLSWMAFALRPASGGVRVTLICKLRIWLITNTEQYSYTDVKFSNNMYCTCMNYWKSGSSCHVCSCCYCVTDKVAVVLLV